MTDNAKILDIGLKKARDMVKNQFILAIKNAAVDMVRDAVNSIGFEGLTGNTVSSLSAGIYVDGVLIDVVSATKDVGVENATRPKITRNEGRNGIVVVTSYATHNKTMVKTHSFVETDKRYGEDTALDFLRSYNVGNSFIAIVMCTGTEYSAYLENVRNLNVLDFTYQYSESIIRKNLNKYFK